MSTPTKTKAPKSPPKSKAPEPEPDLENRLFEALWHGTVDGEDFDGDPADLW